MFPQATHLHSGKVDGEVTTLVFNAETDLEAISLSPFPKCPLDTLLLPVVCLKMMPDPCPCRLERVRDSRALLPCSAANISTRSRSKVDLKWGLSVLKGASKRSGEQPFTQADSDGERGEGFKSQEERFIFTLGRNY